MFDPYELSRAIDRDAALLKPFNEKIDRLKAINAELVEALTLARRCIAYCRRAHPDAQSGTSFPVEIQIDAALKRAKETTR